MYKKINDCLIVGGGIIGMMSARMLTMSGVGVTLIDSKKCATESSWSGGGIISPLYPWREKNQVNDLSLSSQAIYQDLCSELYNSSGIDPQYIKSGLLMTNDYDTEIAKIWLNANKISYIKRENGAFFKSVAQVRSPRLLQALKLDIISKGVKIIENVKVLKVVTKNKIAIGVNTELGNFFAGNVVICSGAWSAKLLNLTQDSIFPMKGQMIVIKAKKTTLKHIILSDNRYIIPRVDGRILVGSTVEDTGFNRDIDESTKKSLYDFALSILPELKNYIIEHQWGGLRPATKNGEIMIGKSTDCDNLFINTGHFRNGLNTAPESANKITKLVVGN